MNKNQFCLVGLTTVLSGCGLLGPTYQQPQINVAAKWSSADAKAQVESSTLSELAWWRKFNDSQLNGLIESALKNNNNLQMAMGNILQAQAALKQIYMGWVPQLSLGGGGLMGQSFNPGFQNMSANPAASSFSPNNPENFNAYGAGFIPSYTLNVFAQIKQGEIAQLSLAMQQQAAAAVRLGVISQVAGSYFTLLGLHQQLVLQQQQLTDSLEMRKYIQIQYQQGSISEFNLAGLDQYIATLKAKTPEIENNITQAENALQVLTNNNPGKILLRNKFDQIATNGVVPLNLPATVLKSRPDIRVAEYQLQVANADIGAMTALFFPSISLTGMLGQGSMQLSNLFNAGGDFWAAAAGAGMPILNLSIYGQIDKAKGSYYMAYYNYIQTVRTAFAQVDNSLATHDSLVRSSAEQNVALEQAGRMYKIVQTQYQQGASSYADTLALKLNIDYANNSMNQLKIQQLSSIVNLYQALGGGYQVESQLTQIKKFGNRHDIN